MIIFQNPGLIDMRAVTTFGVSVKETNSPIGMFGTGLKYAIAVILREGGTITIWRGNRPYHFQANEEEIRGKKFGIVHMLEGALEGEGPNPWTPLSFTTEHGKNWEPWQAFRELWSNTHDEGGKCWQVNEFDADQWHLDNPAVEENIHLPSDHTTITVTGTAMEKAWEERRTIVLETQPMQVLAGVEVHAGESKHLYYQGIRVYELDKPSKYTYNLLNKQHLSEDRKLSYISIPMKEIARAIMTSSWAAHIDDVLRTDDNFLEGKLPWKDVNETVPSPTFVEVAQGVRDERGLRGNAKELFSDLAKTLHNSYGYSDPREQKITAVEQAIIDKALELVRAAKVDVDGMKFRCRSGWSKETKILLSAKEDALIFNSSLLAEADHIEIAKQIVRGMAMKAGGKRENQLANFILFGVFEEQEIGYDDKEDWYE